MFVRDDTSQNYCALERCLKGIAISDGVAFGRVCLANEKRHADLPVYSVDPSEIGRERDRVDHAVARVSDRLDEVARDVADRVGPAEAEIFKAQKSILKDPGILREVLEEIERGSVNAEVAIARTLDRYESRIGELDDEYFKERATDIGEIRRRLLDALSSSGPALLCQTHGHCRRGRERIVVAQSLAPSMTAELDTAHTIGFVSERGGPGSHAAILARALGIPAVSGLDGIAETVSCGTEILLDGTRGEVIVWPTPETVKERLVSTSGQLVEAAIDPVPGLEVLANINMAEQVGEALAMKAEGVGLFRTEFECIAAGRLLTEDQQYEKYAAVLHALDGKSATFRLMDVGGDKALPGLDVHLEPNPYLGLRGARLLLSHPELLRTQARALTRASALGPVRVMYPMIVDRSQFLQLRARFEACTKDLTPGLIEHGVMFEVPAACIEARDIFEVAAFGSIGTNDLVQYVLAVDRNNELVASDYDPRKPAVWSLIRNVVRAARHFDRPLSVCGEAACDRELLGRFVEAGVQTLSVAPRLISEARKAATSLPCGLP